MSVSLVFNPIFNIRYGRNFKYPYNKVVCTNSLFKEPTAFLLNISEITYE